MSGLHHLNVLGHTQEQGEILANEKRKKGHQAIFQTKAKMRKNSQSSSKFLSSIRYP